MPMSFAASLGTTITIIGAPAFLIASTMLQQSGRSGLGIFSIAPIGLSSDPGGNSLRAVDRAVSIADAQRWRRPAQHFRLEDYLTEITVLTDSPFLDKTVSEIAKDGKYHFHVASG